MMSIEIEIQPGQSWGIVGRNGSGKSTLAESLSKKYHGSLVSFEAEDRLLEREIREDDSEFLDRIDFGRTVRELVAEVSPPDEDLESLASTLGLFDLLEQGFLTLSTGERRRLMLASTKPFGLLLRSSSKDETLSSWQTA
jgi:molybdate transport system ATP-binding protein